MKAIKEVLEQVVEKYGTNKISISWEGGNDEGCYDLRIDGNIIDINWDDRASCEYKLIDWFGDNLGYYSFAGDFNCRGEAVYNPETEAFEGEDSYEESKEHDYKFKTPIKLVVPKDLWFDSLVVEVDGYEDQVDVSVRFTILNGPVVEEHANLEKSMKELIEKHILETLCKDVYEINSLYLNEEFSRDSMKVDKDGNYVAVMASMGYYKYDEENKDVSINIS